MIAAALLLALGAQLSLAAPNRCIFMCDQPHLAPIYSQSPSAPVYGHHQPQQQQPIYGQYPGQNIPVPNSPTQRLTNFGFGQVGAHLDQPGLAGPVETFGSVGGAGVGGVNGVDGMFYHHSSSSNSNSQTNFGYVKYPVAPSNPITMYEPVKAYNPCASYRDPCNA